MPKVLILFSSRTGDLAHIADAVAEGAESVKFTEVELRRLDDPAPEGGSAKYRKLEWRDAIAGYDGLIVGVPRDSVSTLELRTVLDRSAGSAKGALVDKVASAFSAMPDGPDGEDLTMSILVPLLRQGMVLVGPVQVGTHVGDAPDLEAARRLGARVAKVAEWIRHAKSHEHSHSHSHGHSHSH